MKTFVWTLLVCVFGVWYLPTQAQRKSKLHRVALTTEMKQAELGFQEKIKSIIKLYTAKGFVIEQEKRIQIKSGIEYQANILLTKNFQYQIVYIGDPLSTKMKSVLFFDGQGELYEDKINIEASNVFWSDMPYYCGATGMYEFTFYQKGKIKYPLSYFILFKRAKG